MSLPFTPSEPRSSCGDTSSTRAISTRAELEMRLVPRSYFCTCWKDTFSDSPSWV